MRNFLRLAAMATLPLLATVTHAQDAVSKTVPLAGIAHIAFRVSDIARTKTFYEKLGFEQAFDIEKDGKTAEAFIKINDRQFIELYPLTTENPKPSLMHLCFQSDELAALNVSYLQRGLKPTEVKKFAAGNLLFSLTGPENQLIEFTQYLPGSLHDRDRGNHLGPHRLANELLSASVSLRDVRAAETFYVKALSFDRVPHTSMFMLPGASREGVILQNSIAPPSVVFAVTNLREIIRALQEQGFAPNISPRSVSLSDPDGTIISFSQLHP